MVSLTSGQNPVVEGHFHHRARPAQKCPICLRLVAFLRTLRLASKMFSSAITLFNTDEARLIARGLAATLAESLWLSGQRPHNLRLCLEGGIAARISTQLRKALGFPQGPRPSRVWTFESFY